MGFSLIGVSCLEVGVLGRLNPQAACTMRRWGGHHDDPFDVGWGIEVSYHFAWSVWGKGYAMELTKLRLQIAHVRLRFAEVIAFGHPDNGASQKVLEKTGFEKRQPATI
jgi:RimJ/RimL family protein N-acetyltransferase